MDYRKCGLVLIIWDIFTAVHSQYTLRLFCVFEAPFIYCVLVLNIGVVRSDHRLNIAVMYAPF